MTPAILKRRRRTSSPPPRNKGASVMPFYEKGETRLYYEDTGGSGFPLLIIPGGGLNSTVEGLKTHRFNPLVESKAELRVKADALRIAKGGHSTGPLEADRPRH